MITLICLWISVSRLLTAALTIEGEEGVSGEDYWKSPAFIRLANSIPHAQIPDNIVIEGINDFDDGHKTPLMNAAYVGHLDAVLQLIRGGAHINLVSRDRNESALHIAVSRGHFDVVSALIDHNADVNLLPSSLYSPLFVATQNGHHRIVERLLSAGANISVANIDGITPIMMAALKGYSKVLHILLHYATPDTVNILNKQGESALILSIISGHIPNVEALIKAGGDVNAVIYKNYTPLIFAARRNYFDIVKLLVEAGANINHRDKFGQSALDHAVVRNFIVILLF